MASGGGLQANWGSEGWADRKVEYCQKFFPNTVAVEMREFVEKITFFNRGNTGPSVSYKPVYDCIQESDNDTNNDSVDLRLDCEEGLIMIISNSSERLLNHSQLYWSICK